MKLHPDVVAIKRAAPKWAKYISRRWIGDWQWASNYWDGYKWVPRTRKLRIRHIDAPLSTAFIPVTICLTTGAVFFDSDDYPCVTQDQWIAARKRKALGVAV